MNKKLMGILGSGILLLWCGLWLIGKGDPEVSKIGAVQEEGLGIGLFQQVRDLDLAQGKLLILASDPDPSTEMLERFEALVDNAPQFELISVEALAGLYYEVPEIAYLDGSHFILLLERFPTAELVISFGGLPILSDEEISYVQSLGMKFMVVSLTGVLPDERLFQADLLEAVILPHHTKVPLNEYMPRTPEEWFAREFVVLTSIRDLLAYE